MKEKEKKIYRWFYGDKEHGCELIACLVNEFGAKNKIDYNGDEERLVYFIDAFGEIQTARKGESDIENLKGRRIRYGANGIEYGDIEEAETIPAEKLKPTSTVVTAPFYKVEYNGCVVTGYYSTYEDVKAAAEKISKEQNTKTYILAPIAKFVPTVTVTEAAFDFSDRPKGC